MKELTDEQRSDRMAGYREMLANWEHTRQNTSEAQADELTKDIRDLQAHLNAMTKVWNQDGHIDRRSIRRHKPPGKIGRKRKYEKKIA